MCCDTPGCEINNFSAAFLYPPVSHTATKANNLLLNIQSPLNTNLANKANASDLQNLSADLKYFSQNRILIGNSENIIVQFTRRGHVVDIVFKGSKPISFPAGGFAFFTLAEQFRPSDYKYISAYGFNMLMQIAPNGEVLTYQELIGKIIQGQCSYSVE